VGTQTPREDRYMPEIVSFGSLTKVQREAAIVMESASILKRLKDGGLQQLNGLPAELVSDFHYLSYCMSGKSGVPADLQGLKKKVFLQLMKIVTTTIPERQYPATLNPVKVYTMMYTHPNEPYRAFIV
jgi:hypothetical protein